MKIILINPPNKFDGPNLPLGLASIAAYLRNQNENIDISVIDAWAEKLTFKEVERRASQGNADIAGIYMLSPCYDAAKEVIKTVRRALPDSTIIAGGPHPSAVPQGTLNDIMELDICAIGEGELTMHELVKAIENNSPLSQIDGLAYRDKNTGEIIVNKPRVLIKNLDSLPLPARDLFPLTKYNPPIPYGKKKPYMTMFTSRGCPFHCSYCSKNVYGDTYRAISPKKVCDEIEGLISKYHVQEIIFYDDDFTLNMQRAEEICDEIIKRGIKLRWSCLTRADLINENLLNKMKKAGCWLVDYGVESGNQKILDTINKGVKIDQMVQAFKMTKKAGIATTAYLLFGLPGETKETVKETFALVKKLKPDFVTCGILIVYPGSRFFNLIQEGKYSGKSRPLKSEDNLSGTYFGRGNFAVFEDKITMEEIKKIIRQAEILFYFRPRYILQRLIDIRSLSDFNYYFRAAIKLMKTII